MSINWKRCAYGGANARYQASEGFVKKPKSLETYGKRDELSCGTTRQHHTKTVVIVAIIRIVVVAIRRAGRAIYQVFPGTTICTCVQPLVLTAKYSKK